VGDGGSLVPENGSQHSASSLPSSFGDHDNGPLAVGNKEGAQAALPAGYCSEVLPPAPAVGGDCIEDPLGAASLAAGDQGGVNGQEGQGSAAGSRSIIALEAVAPGTKSQAAVSGKTEVEGDKDHAAVSGGDGGEDTGVAGQDGAGNEGGATGSKGKPLKGAVQNVMSWGSGWGQKLQRNGNANKASPANSQQELSSM
jgi:hypothetical protein